MEAKNVRSPDRMSSKSSKSLDDGESHNHHPPPHHHHQHAAEKRDDDEDEDEEILDMKVEREWKHLVNSAATESVVSKDPKAVSIVQGFTM